MKIVSVKPCILSSPLPLASAELQPTDADRCYLFRLETEEGQCALGEAYLLSEQHLADAVELFAPVLEGANPLDRGVLWERLVGVLTEAKLPLEQYMGALSAVDVALWDLAGQACGLPVFQLLGGAHFFQLDTYFLPPPRLATDAELLQWAQALPHASVGGIGLEVNYAGGQNLSLVRQMRRKLGGQRRIMVRLAESCPDMATAQQVAQALEKAEVFWVENLLPAGHWSEYAGLRQSLDVPLAAGNDLWGVQQFHELTQSGAVDLAMVDLRICGGITAAVKIAELARLGGMRVAFHGGQCPLTTLAAAHVSAAVPIALPVALPAGFIPGGEYFTFAGQLEDGFLKLSDEPGLGGSLAGELSIFSRTGLQPV